MLTSELIKRLQELQKEHGDLDVTVFNPEVVDYHHIYSVEPVVLQTIEKNFKVVAIHPERDFL